MHKVPSPKYQRNGRPIVPVSGVNAGRWQLHAYIGDPYLRAERKGKGYPISRQRLSAWLDAEVEKK